jgi:hypothetical protein
MVNDGGLARYRMGNKAESRPVIYRLNLLRVAASRSLACIIYWQVKEISRVIQEGDPQAANIDLSLGCFKK